LTSPNRGDGKTGFTHLCLPQLGKDPVYQGEQHGPARRGRWEVRSERLNQLVVDYRLVESCYPSSLDVVVRHVVDNHGYFNQTEVVNVGDRPMATNIGWHNYWDNSITNQLKDIELDDKDISSLIKTGSNEVNLQTINKLAIPGKPILRLTQEGYGQAVLWSASDPATNQQDNHYFCLEPIQRGRDQFGKEQSLIKPKEKIILKWSLEY
jgi:galactose mutarotase-like enzyme